MPRGPQGQKDPPNIIGAANLIGRISTGEIEDDIISKPATGVADGKARA